MRFARLPIREAVDSLLAQPIRRPGLALAKGHRLEATDIARLRLAGIETVSAVTIETGDVLENVAAARIAAALAGADLRAATAHAGRCDLVANAPGLLLFDPQAVCALNLLDEAVTLATLPPNATVAPGEVVATIKVNPFAVPDRLVAAWTAMGPVFGLAPLRPHRAALIQTATAETRPSVLDKTATATRQRLTRLGSRLTVETRVEHESAALAAEITARIAEGADLLLICGAHSVCDRGDVVPAAIVAAGGVVERFGLPVDPGNLLLLGRIGAVAVVGLPGCARASVANGLDLVLPRHLAGLPLAAADIAAMGVGGLLHGRAETSKSPAAVPLSAKDEPRIAAVVLAAGRSRRMGCNKLVVDLEGKPILRHVLDAIAAAPVAHTVVVLGHEADRVRAAAGDIPGDGAFVVNEAFGEGLSTSLKRGLAALPTDVDAAMIFLGDMPDVDTRTIERAIAVFDPEERRAIVVPRRAGRQGHPVLWDRTFFPVLMETCRGDSGAKHLLTRHADRVVEIDADHDGVLLDLDTPEALATRRAARASRPSRPAREAAPA